MYDRSLSRPYIAGTEHVGVSLTGQTSLAPRARGRGGVYVSTHPSPPMLFNGPCIVMEDAFIMWSQPGPCVQGKVRIQQRRTIPRVGNTFSGKKRCLMLRLFSVTLPLYQNHIFRQSDIIFCVCIRSVPWVRVCRYCPCPSVGLGPTPYKCYRPTLVSVQLSSRPLHRSTLHYIQA